MSVKRTLLFFPPSAASASLDSTTTKPVKTTSDCASASVPFPLPSSSFRSEEGGGGHQHAHHAQNHHHSLGRGGGAAHHISRGAFEGGAAFGGEEEKEKAKSYCEGKRREEHLNDTAAHYDDRNGVACDPAAATSNARRSGDARDAAAAAVGDAWNFQQRGEEELLREGQALHPFAPLPTATTTPSHPIISAHFTPLPSSSSSQSQASHHHPQLPPPPPSSESVLELVKRSFHNYFLERFAATSSLSSTNAVVADRHDQSLIFFDESMVASLLKPFCRRRHHHTPTHRHHNCHSNRDECADHNALYTKDKDYDDDDGRNAAFHFPPPHVVVYLLEQCAHEALMEDSRRCRSSHLLFQSQTRPTIKTATLPPPPPPLPPKCPKVVVVPTASKAHTAVVGRLLRHFDCHDDNNPPLLLRGGGRRGNKDGESTGIKKKEKGNNGNLGGSFVTLTISIEHIVINDNHKHNNTSKNNNNNNNNTSNNNNNGLMIALPSSFATPYERCFWTRCLSCGHPCKHGDDDNGGGGGGPRDCGGHASFLFDDDSRRIKQSLSVEQNALELLLWREGPLLSSSASASSLQSYPATSVPIMFGNNNNSIGHGGSDIHFSPSSKPIVTRIVRQMGCIGELEQRQQQQHLPTSAFTQNNMSLAPSSVSLSSVSSLKWCPNCAAPIVLSSGSSSVHYPSSFSPSSSSFSPSSSPSPFDLAIPIARDFRQRIRGFCSILEVHHDHGGDGDGGEGEEKVKVAVDGNETAIEADKVGFDNLHRHHPRQQGGGGFTLLSNPPPREPSLSSSSSSSFSPSSPPTPWLGFAPPTTATTTTESIANHRGGGGSVVVVDDGITRAIMEGGMTGANYDNLSTVSVVVDSFYASPSAVAAATAANVALRWLSAEQQHEATQHTTTITTSSDNYQQQQEASAATPSTRLQSSSSPSIRVGPFVYDLSDDDYEAALVADAFTVGNVIRVCGFFIDPPRRPNRSNLPNAVASSSSSSFLPPPLPPLKNNTGGGNNNSSNGPIFHIQAILGVTKTKGSGGGGGEMNEKTSSSYRQTCDSDQIVVETASDFSSLTLPPPAAARDHTANKRRQQQQPAVNATHSVTMKTSIADDIVFGNYFKSSDVSGYSSHHHNNAAAFMMPSFYSQPPQQQIYLETSSSFLPFSSLPMCHNANDDNHLLHSQQRRRRQNFIVASEERFGRAVREAFPTILAASHHLPPFSSLPMDSHENGRSSSNNTMMAGLFPSSSSSEQLSSSTLAARLLLLLAVRDKLLREGLLPRCVGAGQRGGGGCGGGGVNVGNNHLLGEDRHRFVMRRTPQKLTRSARRRTNIGEGNDCDDDVGGASTVITHPHHHYPPSHASSIALSSSFSTAAATPSPTVSVLLCGQSEKIKKHLLKSLSLFSIRGDCGGGGCVADVSGKRGRGHYWWPATASSPEFLSSTSSPHRPHSSSSSSSQPFFVYRSNTLALTAMDGDMTGSDTVIQTLKRAKLQKTLLTATDNVTIRRNFQQHHSPIIALTATAPFGTASLIKNNKPNCATTNGGDKSSSSVSTISCPKRRLPSTIVVTDACSVLQNQTTAKRFFFSKRGSGGGGHNANPNITTATAIVEATESCGGGGGDGCCDYDIIHSTFEAAPWFRGQRRRVTAAKGKSSSLLSLDDASHHDGHSPPPPLLDLLLIIDDERTSSVEAQTSRGRALLRAASASSSNARASMSVGGGAGDSLQRSWSHSLSNGDHLVADATDGSSFHQDEPHLTLSGLLSAALSPPVMSSTSISATSSPLPFATNSFSSSSLPAAAPPSSTMSSLRQWMLSPSEFDAIAIATVLSEMSSRKGRAGKKMKNKTIVMMASASDSSYSSSYFSIYELAHPTATSSLRTRILAMIADSGEDGRGREHVPSRSLNMRIPKALKQYWLSSAIVEEIVEVGFSAAPSSSSSAAFFSPSLSSSLSHRDSNDDVLMHEAHQLLSAIYNATAGSAGPSSTHAHETANTSSSPSSSPPFSTSSAASALVDLVCELVLVRARFDGCGCWAYIEEDKKEGGTNDNDDCDGDDPFPTSSSASPHEERAAISRFYASPHFADLLSLQAEQEQRETRQRRGSNKSALKLHVVDTISDHHIADVLTPILFHQQLVMLAGGSVNGTPQHQPQYQYQTVPSSSSSNFGVNATTTGAAAAAAVGTVKGTLIYQSRGASSSASSLSFFPPSAATPIAVPPFNSNNPLQQRGSSTAMITGVFGGGSNINSNSTAMTGGSSNKGGGGGGLRASKKAAALALHRLLFQNATASSSSSGGREVSAGTIRSLFSVLPPHLRAQVPTGDAEELMVLLSNNGLVIKKAGGAYGVLSHG